MRWGAWELPAALVPLALRRVGRARRRTGLVVPPSEDGIDETLDVLDGIVFSGGIDIDPDAYGAERHPETDRARPDRDARRAARCSTAALERDLPRSRSAAGSSS